MIKIHKSYRPDGTVRAVWSDENGPGFRAARVVPKRASRIEVIPDGSQAGFFHVDFTLLSEITGDYRHRVCLAKPFSSYSEAVAAEIRWLETNWVLECSSNSA